MNREIKFRAKHVHAFSKNRKLDGIWVYGYYCDENYIRTDNAEKLIDKNTLGQYTGFKDINDKEIYEGDIVNIIVNNNVKNYGKIIFKDGCYVVSIEIPEITPSLDWIIGVANVEIIGNIYENPELLEESED